MADPQTEDGYTRIANELLEALCRFDFSKRQYKVVLVVIRKTYGYGKKSDDMTITQIMLASGLALSHASVTVKELCAMNVLLKREGRHGYVLGINKNYNTWTTYQNGNVTETGNQNGNNHLPKREVSLTETVNTKENSKRKLQKKTHPLFSRFYQAFPRKLAPAQAEKAFARINPDENLLNVMLMAIENQQQARALKEKRGDFVPDWKYPATWLNAECWKDEVEVEQPKTRRVVV